MTCLWCNRVTWSGLSRHQLRNSVVNMFERSDLLQWWDVPGHHLLLPRKLQRTRMCLLDTGAACGNRNQRCDRSDCYRWVSNSFFNKLLFDVFLYILEQTCPDSDCTALSGNGQCDVSCLFNNDSTESSSSLCFMQSQCNSYECDYDGGDCSLGIGDPFVNCPDSLECQLRFHDGSCDLQCNNENCLFDGFDCQPAQDICPWVKLYFVTIIFCHYKVFIVYESQEILFLVKTQLFMHYCITASVIPTTATRILRTVIAMKVATLPDVDTMALIATRITQNKKPTVYWWVNLFPPWSFFFIIFDNLFFTRYLWSVYRLKIYPILGLIFFGPSVTYSTLLSSLNWMVPVSPWLKKRNRLAQ